MDVAAVGSWHTVDLLHEVLALTRLAAQGRRIYNGKPSQWSNVDLRLGDNRMMASKTHISVPGPSGVPCYFVCTNLGQMGASLRPLVDGIGHTLRILL